MTANPDALPQGAAAPLSLPLLRLFPWAGQLAVLGLALCVAAAILVAVVPGLAALVLASAGVTLLVVAGLASVVARRSASRRSLGALALATSLGDDPDPVLVTDSHGTTRAVNRAAADQPRVIDRLVDWCADPVLVCHDMLSDCRHHGRSQREYFRNAKGLRVTAHASEMVGGLIVWRFAALERGRGSDADTVTCPIVTFGVGRPRPNGAAQALLDVAHTGVPDRVLTLLATAATRPYDVTSMRLPDGRNLGAMAVPGAAGRTDLVLLPEQALPTFDLGRDDTAPTGFEDIPVALAELDPEGQIVATNRLARTLLGLGDGDAPHFWEVVEGLGRPVSDWLDDARASRALGRPEVLRATLTPEETFVQIILRRATGRDGEGALVAVISDATELKSLEARFVQSQKMQAIGQLAGGVAHDFNNLLTAISGHCDLLLMNRDRYDPDYNDLLQIHQNANRAAALVRQLLAFSRKQTLKPETFRLESLLEDLTHLLTRLVGERITLDLNHDPELSPIRADRRQLEQVIMNLVVNARDAMPMGGTIRIETRTLRLEAELEHGRARVPPGDYATIRVIDEGIGIPAGIIDKVFEPFFTTKRMGEGTGLGLSTAYGIVKQMGGYIFADSVEGSGTTFTLYFASQPDGAVPAPAVPRSPNSGDVALAAPHQIPGRFGSGGAETAARLDMRPGAAGPTAPPSADRVGQTALGKIGEASGSILLVEDEAPVRAFAARALRLQGYRVFEAQDGEQALEFLADRSLQVDLFVTDVIMPGIDGPGWVGEALLDRPGTPVVFMSGYTEDTLSAALSRIPRQVFLGKPFSLKELSDTIQRQMELPTLR